MLWVLIVKQTFKQWKNHAYESNFKELCGKKICIDIYNYIYTFLGNNRFMKNYLNYMNYKKIIFMHCLFLTENI